MKTGISLGVLGCAKINQVAMIDAAAEVPEVTLLAASSRSEEYARSYALRHKISRYYGSYEALLADPDIDIVYNPLPNHLHESWTIAALEAGKHVLVEKPLSANADEARRMNLVAKEHSLHLIEAFHYRYHPMAIEILRQLKMGAIGEINRVEISLKVDKRLLETNDIRLSFDSAGGSAMDLGAYGINFMRAMLDAPTSVESAIPNIVAENIDGSMDVLLRFSNGAEGVLGCSIVHDSMESLVRVQGEKGTLEAKNPFLPQFGNSLKITIDGEETKLRFPTTTTYVYQLQGVADCILRSEPCLTPGVDGIANMHVLDQVYAAAGLKVRGK